MRDISGKYNDYFGIVNFETGEIISTKGGFTILTDDMRKILISEMAQSGEETRECLLPDTAKGVLEESSKKSICNRFLSEIELLRRGG